MHSRYLYIFSVLIVSTVLSRKIRWPFSCGSLPNFSANFCTTWFRVSADKFIIRPSNKTIDFIHRRTSHFLTHILRHTNVASIIGVSICHWHTRLLVVRLQPEQIVADSLRTCCCHCDAPSSQPIVKGTDIHIR